jgi:hypothetical protein
LQHEQAMGLLKKSVPWYTVDAVIHEKQGLLSYACFINVLNPPKKIFFFFIYTSL